MIVSAMITRLRNAVRDVPRSTQAIRAADGSSTLFVLPKAPVVEGSYSVYFGTSAQTENAGYTIDKDNGEITTFVAQGNGLNIKTNYKYANFRDADWVNAVNYGVDALNGRGFFKQTVRSTFNLSANIQTYSGPTSAIDMYEVFSSNNNSISGFFSKLPMNWEYQQDANKLVLGAKPTVAMVAQVSYLRNLNKYTATSATLDVKTDWEQLVELKAKEYYWRSMASKIAQQGNATIDEGHFSFTNMRTMANDMQNAFEFLAKSKKPTRPTKDTKFYIQGQPA